MDHIVKNGLTVSRLTLGTVQLGLPYGIANKTGMPSEDESFEILEEAWNSGVVSFDTATAYGRSEEILGRYFKGKKPTIITKLHVRPSPGAGSDEVEREMRAIVESSLCNLGIRSVPLLLLHNTDVLATHGDAVIAGFRSLKREGMIEYAGISVSRNTDEEYRLIGDKLYDDTFEAVQFPLNILDHRPIRYGVLKRLKEAGKLVFARSLFLQGLIYLTERELPEHLREASALLAAIKELAQRCGVSVSQMAVSFVRDLEGVDSLVIGAETPVQVRENVRLLVGPSLPESLTEEIMRRFSEVPDYIITPHLWKKGT